MGVQLSPALYAAGDDAIGQGSQGGGGYSGGAPTYGGQPAAVTTRLSRTQVEDSLGRLFKGELLFNDDDTSPEASALLTVSHASKDLSALAVGWPDLC